MTRRFRIRIPGLLRSTARTRRRGSWGVSVKRRGRPRRSVTVRTGGRRRRARR
ncbi:hypothetical protein [Acidipropionibacterium virtanenii]|uniref:Uncharacterized protein n=1 Tax=Acidipropionibacterium virtanenii TaxID=2057246 RepID=A0A344UXP8_9ACTN|nr:hypothetical protein [Acidipropionibacterium virtanenii]AXE40046.1 hypothetical protein JS278_02912 [Acidipropionibacterium virtanenii]